MCSAFTATYTAILMNNPSYTLKTRYQVMPTEKICPISFGRNIIATEGFVKGLYLPGLFANAAAIATGAMGRVGLYPSVRDFMLKKAGCKEGSKPAGIMMAAGCVSGSVGFICA